MTETTATAGGQFWKFLASIRLTVILLLSLAATSIVGTLIPQNESPTFYLQKYGQVRAAVFHTLDLFDMYHSWWFQLLIVLLTANIVVCSIDRLLLMYRVIWPPQPPFHRNRFLKQADRREFDMARPAGTLRPLYESLLKKQFGYVKVEDTPEGFAIFAESGRKTRLGVYVVHLSVVMLLVGAMIGSLFGFDGYVNVPEGGEEDTIQLRSGEAPLKLDVAIRCEDFDVSFYETGAPKEFRSKLVLLRGGVEVARKDIVVNDPLHFEGLNIFQSSYGSMPPDKATLQGDGVTLAFTSNDSGMAYRVKAVPGQAVEIPEGGGSFVLTEVLPSYLFMGQRDLGETLVGELRPLQGEPVTVYLPLRFPVSTRCGGMPASSSRWKALPNGITRDCR